MTGSSSPFDRPGCRLFVLDGMSDDHFCLPDGSLAAPDRFLWEHLRAVGFECIALVAHHGLYFLDDGSAQLAMAPAAPGPRPPAPAFAGQAAPVPQAAPAPARPAPTAPASPPPPAAGLVQAPGGLSLRRCRQPPAAGSALAAAAGPPASTMRRLYRGLHDSAELIPLLRKLLLRDEPRTAVIFFSPSYLLEEGGARSVAMHHLRETLLSELQATAGPANRSCAIFRFATAGAAELERQLRERGAFSWLFGLDEQGQPCGAAELVQIAGPGRDEVRDLIDRTRLRRRLTIDWAAREQLEVELTAEARSRPMRLVELAGWLERAHRLDRELVAAICGRPLARSAAEQLEELIGLTEVKAHFARWRNAAAALRSQAPAPPPGSLRRGWARPERLCPSPSRSSPLNLHLLLTGSPGTGKTTVARLVGALYRELGLLELGHCLVVTRADLVGGYLGQTALRTRDAIDRALGGVLFLDEAYDTWRGPEDDFGQEAITTLLEAMSREEGRFAVVAAGYPGQMERWLQANPGLPRRFGERLHLADPGPAELQQLFERQLQRHPAGVSCAPELAEKLPAFFQALHGGRDERFGNCGEIVLLAEQTARAALARRARILRAEDLPERHRPLLETRPVGPGGLLVELDALVGLHRAKEQVRTWFHRLAIERRRQGEQARLAPGHLLFFGSPGTGKTTVARLMAEQLFALGLLPRRSLQRTTAQELIRGFVGQTSEAALTFLRQGLGGVIFIDEAHQLYAGQEADRASFGRDVLRALVPFAEDHRQECCIILAGYTVGLQLLLQADEGLAERFAAHVLFEDYDEAEMVQIFQGFCRQARPRPLLPEPELLGRLPLRFAALRAGLGGQFANARTVRKLYERCLDRQAERLASAGTEELGPDELFTLRSVDLPPVEQGWRDEEQGGPAPPAWR